MICTNFEEPDSVPAAANASDKADISQDSRYYAAFRKYTSSKLFLAAIILYAIFSIPGLLMLLLSGLMSNESIRSIGFIIELIILAAFPYILIILIAVGMYKTYRSAADNDPIIKTNGLSMIKKIQKILSVIFAIVAVVDINLIIRGREINFFTIGLLLVSAFLMVYIGRVVKMLDSLILFANKKSTLFSFSAFVIVGGFILAFVLIVFPIITAILSKSVDDIILSMSCGFIFSAALILFMILLLKYRNKVQRISYELYLQQRQTDYNRKTDFNPDSAAASADDDIQGQCDPTIPESFDNNDTADKNEEPAREQSAKWQSEGRCRYCGGKFKGIFKEKCSVCGREKDYFDY